MIDRHSREGKHSDLWEAKKCISCKEPVMLDLMSVA